jgi:hypothetical protein
VQGELQAHEGNPPHPPSFARRTLYKLLRCTCLHCFKLRMAEKEVQRYVARLTLLLQGRLTEAQGIVTGGSAAAKKASGGEEEVEEEAGSPLSVLEGGCMRSMCRGRRKGRNVNVCEEGGATCRDLYNAQQPWCVQRFTRHAAAGPAPSRRSTAMTGQSLEAAIDTMSEIFKRQPVGKCANCGAFSPVIKK